MNCEQFQLLLQQSADGKGHDLDLPACRRHLLGCQECRDLELGFRLIAQGFAASSMPQPSAQLSDQVLAQVLKQPEQRGMRSAGQLWWLTAAAAVLLAAVALEHFFTGMHDAVPSRPPLTGVHSDMPDSPHDLVKSDSDLLGTDGFVPAFAEHKGQEQLFPESGDNRDVIWIGAFAPLSDVLHGVRSSIETPVRPLAQVTSDALESFFRELPSTAPRSLREYMPAKPPTLQPRNMESESSS